MTQLWVCFVEDKFDLEFSFAIAVMDRTGGWEEEEGEQEHWVGPRVASMWVYTKAVVCNRQNHMHNYKIFKIKSVMEVVNWVCGDALDEHVCVVEKTISLQAAEVLEALQK